MERYILNIINAFHGKDPVKEDFRVFDSLDTLRTVWEDRILQTIQAITLTEGFANPSEKTDILTIVYTVIATLVIGFLIGVFIIAFSSFNMSWAYNKALGKTDLETSYWAALCFVFFIAYFPYYGIILQPLRIKSPDSIVVTLSNAINPFLQIGLPTWEWAFSGVFTASGS
jgi:hypothetical protein